MFRSVSSYLSLIKFSHTVFALPFALLGFFTGAAQSGGGIPWRTFPLVLLCMVFARSAAMAFNRYADRDIDSANKRTLRREIPAGSVRPSSALLFAIINALLFVLTTRFINDLCFFLSPVALFVIFFYSYTKRFTHLSHFILGLGLSLAPVGAYIAVTGGFALHPILYSLAVLFWVSGFDVIYSLQDEAFDRERRLKSLPALLGKRRALNVSALMHLLAAAFLVWAGIREGGGVLYWAGTLLFSAMLVYQHTLVKPDDLSRVNAAFFTSNGIAAVIFSVFAIGDLYFTFPLPFPGFPGGVSV